MVALKQAWLIATLPVMLTAGCQAVNPDFARAVAGYTKVILPDYKQYVENDPGLSPDTKRVRVQTADKFQQLVDEANTP